MRRLEEEWVAADFQFSRDELAARLRTRVDGPD